VILSTPLSCSGLRQWGCAVHCGARRLRRPSLSLSNPPPKKGLACNFHLPLLGQKEEEEEKLYFLILSYKSARAIYFGRLFEPNGRGGGGGKEEKIRSVPSSSSYSISYSLTHSVPSFHAGQVRLHFQSKPAFFFFLSDKTTATLILLLLLPLVIGI
jgi:hypothetical protein